jgi:hypothetical protein
VTVPVASVSVAAQVLPRRPSSFCIHPSDFPRPRPGRTETFAFLFDMNQFFEEFIAQLVRRSLPFSEGGFIRRELREVWQSRDWTLHAHSLFTSDTTPMLNNQI